MASFFDQNAYEELHSRLKNIELETVPKWGKMTAAQMINHCQGPLKIAVNKSDITMKPNWLVKVLFKKMMYSSKPYRKNVPTPIIFRSTGGFNFEKEKLSLQKYMDELWEDRDNESRTPHPVFGKFTKEQWGIMQWKHLNHHFDQFGV
ncbi:DUF1569 domain-containing protein [Nonlabens sp. Ci31]|jgi:hypothetical protein|uniref:DUF1569 domain-containing protein n=1 Tax=Nonlabens sp. Ci31 TaxID=2608253 RepID=UPI001463F4CF|nr:DUF1569 domain-containing protein [Nonlabens sp. Ci31]QJP33295.1 DUF1569 domain-containing protein [Nonlabens sp. Ci31]